MSKFYSFDELTDSVELLEKKPPRFIMGLLYFLLIGLLGFLMWAYFGKIDIVSKGPAFVQGNSEVSVSRSQVPGIIEKIAVHSGDEVKKGDVLLQLQNKELTEKNNQSNEIVKHLESQKNMLEQLKQSILRNKNVFSNEVDPKISEEYNAYQQGYQVLQNEKDIEIKSLDSDKVVDNQDDALLGLNAEKENIQREIKNLKHETEKPNVPNEQKQVVDEKIKSLEAQFTSLEKRAEQRKVTLEEQRKKMDTILEGKKEQKQYALKQYQENTVAAVNQRIFSLEQEIFLKNQEVSGLRNQMENVVIKAQRDGIVQFPSVLQNGDLIESGQEIVSVIPKETQKKVHILLPPQEINGIKKGDKVQYSFKLKDTDKQMGKVTYISAHPTFDKDSKSYMYALEATIDTKELNELKVGIIGRAAVVTGKEPIWKFILQKLDFI
ncbi:HlyD family efflux transporter periplasmic adaptor subunit [Bacillus wiedmannii]|uniref:HlyD family efflux transporter periplasmic adaptor subunit n=1 Tax=Bacillus wiedmannii TaxID=1890302 RepID=UPI0007DB17C5|nr:HlyD family efflux transporter periplasmic adaptor subunit [Bacillus wiedmannii]OAK08704.1 hemolysin D [Bacillus wiedmannii]QWH69428.1 HlyD family efflux transporter periplasmic adaptor subunit [Bacillus wiedmannii]